MKQRSARPKALAPGKAKRSELEQKLAEALEQQAATAEILDVISRSPTDVQPVFDIVAAKAVKLCDASFSVVTRFDGELVHVAATCNLSPEAADAIRNAFPAPPSGRGATSRAILNRAIVHIPDVADDPEYSPGGLAQATKIRSIIAVPMLRGGSPLGAISASRPQPRPFTDHQISMLKTFADQAAIAIENVRLFNETKEALERQTATAEILKVISSSPSDVQPVFDAIVRSAASLFQPCDATITMLEDGFLRWYATAGVERTQMDVEKAKAVFPLPFDPDRSPSSRAILERRVVEIMDVAAPDTPAPARIAGQAGGFRSAVFVPLLRAGEGIGTIILTHPQPGFKLTGKQLALVQTFADQAVIAIENVRLFKELETRNRDLSETLDQQTATAEILRVISSSPTTLDPVLEAVVKTAARLCDATNASLYRVEGDLMRKVAGHGSVPTAIEVGDTRPVTRGTVSGLAILERRTLHIPDLLAEADTQDPVSRDYVRREGIRTFVATPLLREGVPIGAITVYRTEVRLFSDKQIGLLQTFADQAVIAIENVRLFNETKEALERQTATAEILKVISSSPTDIQPVLDAVAANAARLCDASDAMIQLREGNVFRFAAHHGTIPNMPLGATREISRELVTGRAFLEGRQIHVHDLQSATEEYPQGSAIAKQFGYRTILVTPLMREGTAIGTIMVRRTEALPFSDSHLALVKTFADQAVIAIENVRLFNETKEALEQQTATADILGVISTSPTDVQPVFQAIAERARVLSKAHVGMTTRLDGEMLHLVGVHGVSDQAEATLRAAFPMQLELAPPNARRAILERAPIQIPDVLLEPGYRHVEGAKQAGFRSILSVPLLHEGRAIGTIGVARQEPGAFPEKVVALLQTFARQAVIAIENVRLFNETKEALERQTATAEILKVISGSVADTQPVFDKIVQSCERIFQGFLVGISVVGEDGRLHLGAYHGPGDKEFASLFPMPLNRDTGAGSAILARQVMHYPDTQGGDDSPEYVRRASKVTGVKALIFAPMLLGERGIGAIFVARDVVGPFSDKQIALLKTFADQAVIAIENVRLFNETKEALERQTATAAVLQVISGSMSDAAPVFAAILESSERLIVDAAGSSINLIGDDGLVHADYFRLSPAGRAAFPTPADADKVEQRMRTRRPQPLAGSITELTIRAGRALTYADVLHGADVPDSLRAAARAIFGGEQSEQSYAVGTVPLLKDGRGLGTITVARMRLGEFSEKELSLLRIFADQAVVAIENARLFNETKEALERQTATAEILRVISSSPTDAQPVFDAIVRSAVRLFDPANASILMREGDAIHLRALSPTVLAAALDVVRKLFPMPFDPERVLIAHVMAQGQVTHIPDTEEAGHWPRVPEVARAGKYRSITAVPLLLDAKGIGVIVLTHPQAGFGLTEKQLGLVQTFAAQAVIAIENVRLFNETKEALEQQKASSEVLRVISRSVADTSPVFEAIAAACARLFEGHQIGINLVDDEGRIRLRACEGPNREMLHRYFSEHVETERGTDLVLKGGVAHFPDTEGEGVPAKIRDGCRVWGSKAIVYAAMTSAGRGIGAIWVARNRVGPFSEKEIGLLSSFADQAVIAIQNARLFNETQEALERQTATAEILKVISSSPTDVQPVLDAVAESAARLCEASDAVIQLTQGDVWWPVAHHGSIPYMPVGTVRPVSRGRVTGRAIIEGKQIHVHDLQAASEEYPEGSAVAQEFGTRTSLATPLLREGKAIGAIFIRRTEVRPFSDKQLALVQTFADQAVIAIENVRLFNETKEALEQQKASAEVLSVISNSVSDAAPVFESIVQSCQRLFVGSNTIISLVGEDGQVRHEAIAAQHGLNVEDIRTKLDRDFPRPLKQSYQAYPIRKRQVVHYPDIVNGPKVPEGMRQLGRDIGNFSMLIAPMLWEGKGIGTIHVTRIPPVPFTEKEFGLLRTFADQAVIAIQNARLFNETREALERQTATAEILRVISSSPTDVQPVFDAIVDSTHHLIIGKSTVLLLRQESQFVVARYFGARLEDLPDHVRTAPLDRDKNFPSRAILDGEVVHVTDWEGDDVPEHEKSVAKAFGIRSGLIVPLLRKGEGIGAIAVAREMAGPYHEKEISLLQSFADQAVIAIENVRLFKELEARTEALTRSVGQLTALGEVGQAISSTLDLETVLKTIVSRAVQLTGLDGGSIFEYDERAEEFHLRATENVDEEYLAILRQTPIRKGEGAVGRAALTGEPTQIPDIQDQSYQSRLRVAFIRAGYRAVLVVPLRREEHVIGALSVTRKAPGTFAPEVVELLKTFATQSAMAIQNARLFREIAEKGRQLEEASQHKSQFLASMSHELRTPLNAILGFNEMILAEVYGTVPGDMKEPLADIQTSGKHLLRLINNVLDLAKIEAGRMELALSDYSVHDTVESVRATLRPLAADKGLEFVTSVPAELPLAFGDAGRITQCLMNLAGNSLKFTKAGKVEISVELKDGTLVYRVADTGIGIPPEKIGSLFTEFKQTDATIASEYGGTGLGLSISKKFIEMHGGRIWVESELGKGSSFIFRIPLRAGEGNAA